MAGTLASSLIQSAYREGNLIPAGTNPTTAEQDEALNLLNNVIGTAVGFFMGEKLLNWNIPAPQRTGQVAANYPQLPYPQGLDAELLGTPFNYDLTQDMFQYPPKNSRVVWGSVSYTAYFPEAPDNGSRMAVVQGSGAGDGGASGATLILDGNGRTIEGQDTQTYNPPVTAREWMYRDDLADWVVLQDLALTDSCAFPTKHDQFWITQLAMRLNPRYGKTTAPETITAFKQAFTHFKTAYAQAGVTTYNSQGIPRTLQSYMSGHWWW